MNKAPSLIADLLTRLDTERRYEFEERAGTIEFDAGVPRDDAECLALIDLLRTYPGALVGITALEIWRKGTTGYVVTTDVESAQTLFELTGVRVQRVVDLADLVQRDFHGVAWLTRFE